MIVFWAPGFWGWSQVYTDSNKFLEIEFGKTGKLNACEKGFEEREARETEREEKQWLLSSCATYRPPSCSLHACG